jgi:polyhydroxyalkanoate synthesis regulator phasin
MTKRPRNPYEDDQLNRDLDDDFNLNLQLDMKHRLEHLERQITADQITADARALMSDDDPDPDPDVARGEQVLAKAQDVFQRMGTPEDVLERAQKVMVNPVDIGIVSGFLAVGTKESFAKALSLVTEQEDRNARAHAETAVNGVLDDFDAAEDTQSLRDEVTDLRQQVATLTGRVAQLESNSALARSASAPQQVIAKGYEYTSSSAGKNRPDGHRPFDDAASLMSRGQGVIDSVSTIGVLSSLISDGKLSEARSMVEAAELDHEAKVKAAERKRLR